VHGDLGLLDAVIFEAGGGESLGQGLDELDWLPGHDLMESMGYVGVANGLG
jgi:hypothetical protein